MLLVSCAKICHGRIILQSICGQATVLEVQRWGCASLRDLAQASSEDRSWLGRLGGIELVLNAMRTFEADTELQQSACGALATLSYENQVNTKAVLQHGGTELLLRAMHGHSSSPSVQGLACYVLRILAFLEEGRHHMVQLGAIETILMALRNHIGDVDVQGSGCGVLGRLTACSSEDLAKVASGDGLGVALGALSAHPRDAQVQACASALVGNLVLAGPQSVQEIAQSRAADLVVQASKHESLEAQSCAVNALNNMCLRSEHCIAQAAVSGAYASLAATFQPTDENIQLLTITVLYLLTTTDQGDVGDFVQLQGLSHLIPTMMRFMSSLKVQEQISSILQSRSLRPFWFNMCTVPCHTLPYLAICSCKMLQVLSCPFTSEHSITPEIAKNHPIHCRNRTSCGDVGRNTSTGRAWWHFHCNAGSLKILQ